ncbi:hypothetical protein IPC689_30645 [Pseudomonas aeruginosa]|jgi:hypothetical protein|nr:hypothetical protein AW880_03925 [Pseudomonas aeruginosa]PTZ91081.1 hypothetical protein DB393_08960 [Pseudomonas aeruginosa]RPY47592.1 hypothetical protein IPC689_30645 [Pseudomonas aeruginosa]HBP6544003.1 hypothetical protein [Pseudomonas aeruginosa]
MLSDQRRLLLFLEGQLWGDCGPSRQATISQLRPFKCTYESLGDSQLVFVSESYFQFFKNCMLGKFGDFH